jgi:hypothetical protein
MGKNTPTVDPVAALAALTKNPKAAAGTQPTVASEEERFVQDLNDLLDFVATKVGKSIFDAQALLSAGVEELRIQIRENAEEEEDA